MLFSLGGTFLGADSNFEAAAQAAENSSREPVISGRKIGEFVPSFYARAVTGPLRNKSVCYVCRSGGRPVVMLLLRRIDPELKPLLQELSRLVDRHRAAGLKGFVVLLSRDSIKATSAVQTFSFNHKITIPLMVSGEGVGSVECQNIHAEAAVTIVLYRRRRVVCKFAFRVGELNAKQTRAVISRLRKFAAENPVPAVTPSGQ
ncbi:MAG: hypothetical protein IID45_03550 [Planctomycetes bacterium]|nr:hypothetical protein [Planctomycetota bacterium]